MDDVRTVGTLDPITELISELNAGAEGVTSIQEGGAGTSPAPVPTFKRREPLNLRIGVCMGSAVSGPGGAYMTGMTTSWASFVQRLTAEPTRSEKTMAQYAGLGKVGKTAEKNARGYVVTASLTPLSQSQSQGGKYPAVRAKANLQRVCVAKLDIELTEEGERRLAADPSAPKGNAPLEAVQAVTRALGLEGVFHATRSSCPGGRRWRVYVPFNEGGLRPEDAHRTCHWLCSQFEQRGIAVDRGSSTDLARPAFLPTLSADQEWIACFLPGRPLGLADVPEDYVPPSTFSLQAPVKVPETWEPVDVVALGLPDSVQKLIREGDVPRHRAIFSVCCSLLRAGIDADVILRVVADPEYGISDKVLNEWGKGDVMAGMRHVARHVLSAAVEAVGPVDAAGMFSVVEGTTVREGPPSVLEWLRETHLPAYERHAEDARASFENALPADRPEGFRERMRRLTEEWAQGGELAFAVEYKATRLESEPDKADLKKAAQRLAEDLRHARRHEANVQAVADAIADLEAGGDPTLLPTGWLVTYRETYFPKAPTPPETVESKRKALAAACPDILAAQDVLGLLADAVHQAGVAGEDLLIKGLYLLATSRVFDEPVRTLVLGESSSGKSFATDMVLLVFFPEGAVLLITNMSPKALVDEPDLKHKVLYFAEGAILRNPDPSDEKAYMLRELVSRGKVVHKRDTKDPVTGQYRTETVENEGPVALVVTSTVTLNDELMTRLTVLHTDTSEEQTRAVLVKRSKTHGSRVTLDPEEIAQWHAYQELLSLGHTEVTIPYLPAIGALMSARRNRARRDLDQLITLIRAHTVLHQAHRACTDEGRLVAELRDYEAVRPLLLDMMARDEGYTVSPGVRRLVEYIRAEAVQRYAKRHPFPGESMSPAPTYEDLKSIWVPVSAASIAAALQVGRTSAYEYAKEATDLGYLLNNEGRSRQRMLLSLDCPLPDSEDQDQALPTVQQVNQYMELEDQGI